MSTDTHIYTSYLLSPSILQELVTHFLRISLSRKIKKLNKGCLKIFNITIVFEWQAFWRQKWVTEALSTYPFSKKMCVFSLESHY